MDDASPTPDVPLDRPFWRSESTRRGRRMRLIGLALGAAMVVAAIVFVACQRDGLREAWRAMGDPSAIALVLLPLSVLANVALSGVLFRLLLSRFGRVGWVEMQAVIAAQALVNFIPLRPGLVGRLMYHRAVNQIPLMQSARTVIEAAILSVVVGGYLALAAVASIQLSVNLWLSALAPLPVLALATLHPAFRLWSLAAGVRYVEVIVWAIRYGCAFALIGTPIGMEAALALACVSVLATMVPLFSNGLGLREWAIGLVAPLLAAATLELGIIAELVNRAAEIIIIAIAGLIGMAYLSRQSGRSTSDD